MKKKQVRAKDMKRRACKRYVNLPRKTIISDPRKYNKLSQDVNTTKEKKSSF
jgi:hypothetical protein